MTQVEAKLDALGLTLSAPLSLPGNFVHAVTVGNLVFLSGHVPIRDGAVVFQGKSAPSARSRKGTRRLSS